jgi:hypothetical protein
MKFKLLPLLLIFSLLVMPIVNSMIIEEHPVIGKDALSKAPNSPITQEILPYEDYYHLGNALTDISVVYYFTIDEEEDDNIFNKLFKMFTFRIGKNYRATHSQNACLTALRKADTQKERVLAYGICSHQIEDAVSHNLAVPGAIEKSGMFNGLVHSIKEIHDKDLFTDYEDRVYSREILNLAYEEDVMSFFEEVFKDDNVLSKVDIRGMVDFFAAQVQGDLSGGYKLGFKSFFALPTYIYWLILILFFLSITLFGLVIRRIREGQRDVPTMFTLIFSFGLLAFVSAAIYGLFSKNIWAIWEKLSQFLFSPSMYFVGGALIIIGGYIIYTFLVKKDKIKNIPNVLVAILILSIGAYVVTLPNSLTIGNEQAVYDLAVDNTVKFLNQGESYIRQIEDPVGFLALQKANESGNGARTGVIAYLLIMLGAIIYFTFRRKR